MHDIIGAIWENIDFLGGGGGISWENVIPQSLGNAPQRLFPSLKLRLKCRAIFWLLWQIILETYYIIGQKSQKSTLYYIRNLREKLKFWAFLIPNYEYN